MAIRELPNRKAGRFFQSLFGELKTPCTRFFTENDRFAKKSSENLFNGNQRVAEQKGEGQFVFAELNTGYGRC